MEHQGSTAVAEPSEEFVPARRVSKRRWTWVAIALLLAVGAVAVLARYESHHPKVASTEEVEEGTGGGLPVEVIHPRGGGLVRTTTQAGSVHAFEHAELYAKVSGYLKEQSVDIGDTVKIHQLLAVIDDPEAVKAVQQAKALLEQARAKAQVAKAMVKTAEAQRDASKASVTETEAEVRSHEFTHEYRVKQYNRIKGLVERGATEGKLLDEQRDELDSSTAAVDVARAAVLSARANLMAKEALIQQAQADLAEANAKVDVAQADLEKSMVLEEYTRITSPYDGVVTRRTYHRGDFVRSAADGSPLPILSVARVDKMRVVMPVPDREVRFLDKGDPAVVKIDALPGREFPGKVSRFAMIEDSESRNMRTEVDLENPDGALHEGMYGGVTLILQKAEPNSVTIPSSCLLSQTGSGEATLYAVRSGKARKINVKVGKDNGTEAEIVEGLTPKDEVILRATGTLAEGTLVKADLRDEKAAATGTAAH